MDKILTFFFSVTGFKITRYDVRREKKPTDSVLHIYDLLYESS